jgi:hypothetical protein
MISRLEADKEGIRFWVLGIRKQAFENMRIIINELFLN